MFDRKFIPTKPFSSFKWKWASLQCTESINDPVVLLGVLFRMSKFDSTGIKYSSEQFGAELQQLEKDISDSISINLGGRVGERNIIRNSGQYWKALNLIPSDSRGEIVLTDFGRKVANRQISQTEFSAIIVKTFTLPNPAIQSNEECDLWLRHGLKLHPLHIILSILMRLFEKNRESSFLTVMELTDIIIPLSGCGASIDDYVSFIELYREGDLDLSHWPNCCTGANDVRIAREYLLFLANYGYVLKSQDRLRVREQYYVNTLIIDEINEILNEPIETSVLLEIERKRSNGTRNNRPNQRVFRRDVLDACKRCVITNFEMTEILEAAHIKPYKYNGEDTIANGFAMRTDIHILFDTGHLRISDQGIIELSQTARLDYGSAIPRRIEIPDFINRDFLRWRWENYNGI